MWAGLTLACLAGAPPLVLFLYGEWPERIEPSAVVIWIVASAAVFGLATTLRVLVVGPIRVRRERYRLARMPFPFARDAYLTSLDREGHWSFLRVDVTFVTAPSPALCQSLVAGARGLGIETLDWSGDRSLSFTSATLSTGSNYKGAKSYSNGPVHRLFRRALERMLLPAHRECGIASLAAWRA